MLSGLTAGLAEQSTSAIGRLGSSAATPVDVIAFGAPGSGSPKASFVYRKLGDRRAGGQLEGPARCPFCRTAGRHPDKGTDGGIVGTANVAVFGVSPGSPLAPVEVSTGTAVVGASVAEALSVGQGDKVSLGGVELSVAAVVPDQWYAHTSVVWTALPAWAKAAHVSDAGQLATVVAVTYADGAESTGPPPIPPRTRSANPARDLSRRWAPSKARTGR